MTNKLKIKLTKEQIDSVMRQYRELPSMFHVNSPNLTFEIDIEESQIVKEKTNVEKWFRYFQWNRWSDNYARSLAEDLNRLGCNADAAYKEVVGD